jgi:predicted PhzF superfamily epimerase YddE/YHI9
MRDLCAGIGDLEEPASGTTSAGLTAYLVDHWGRRRLRVHQGIEVGRPSLIETEVHEGGRHDRDPRPRHTHVAW